MRKPIAVRDLPFEFAMNGFRLVEGFTDELFEARTGLPSAASSSERLAPVRPAGWWSEAHERWRATPKGFRFLNEILVELLPDGESGAGPDSAAQYLGVFMHRRPMTGT